MELVRAMPPGLFNNSLQRKPCTPAVGLNGPMIDIVGLLQSQFLQCVDVRCSLQMYVWNTYALLLHLLTTLKGDVGKKGSDNSGSEKGCCPSVLTSGDFLTVSFVLFLTAMTSNGSLRSKLDSKMANKLCETTTEPEACVTSFEPRSRVSQYQKKVDNRLEEMAVCKQLSTTDDSCPCRTVVCGRDVQTAEWILLAARDKEEDDDEDHDDDDEDEDEDEEEEEDDDNKVDAVEDENDLEGDEEEPDEEEADDGEADDNGDGEDDDGEEEGDEEDEDGDEEQEEEEDEDGDQDVEDEDEDEPEGESEEDVEPPRKKRK